jgi:REP element-mobilizing transposase RayT
MQPDDKAAETVNHSHISPDSADQVENPPDWLMDVSRAARYLTRLSLESAFQAVLIVRAGKLWAYAGELSHPAAEELACLVDRYGTNEGGSDLMRFVKLQSVPGEFLLYATGLGWNMTLTLVLDVETPFSHIRLQASRLAKALTSPTENGIDSRNGAVTGDRTESAQDEGPDLDPLAGLPPLFDDVPPPTAAPPVSPRHSSPQPEPVQASADIPGARLDAAQTAGLFDPVSEEATFPADMVLPLAYPAFYRLNYACLLAPRLPDHHLTGDLAERLAEWAPQLCLAFGWRLVRFSIRPDFFQWIVDVPPATSPGALIRIVRQQTSHRIFQEFPRLKRDNPSGDFWAPGYLVMSSSQPLPVKVIQNFINLTRARQGLT